MQMAAGEPSSLTAPDWSSLNNHIIKVMSLSLSFLSPPNYYITQNTRLNAVTKPRIIVEGYY